jgi:uncharacterized protein YoxC
MHMIVNIDNIESQIKNVGKCIDLMKKTVEGLQHIKKRASALFQKATTELSKINIDFDSVDSIDVPLQQRVHRENVDIDHKKQC